jgi:hypothetical protein
MNTYRAIFSKNEIISITEVNDTTIMNGLYQYEHKNGRLIYAVINAETEDNALTMASIIIKEISQMVFGNDYVN